MGLNRDNIHLALVYSTHHFLEGCTLLFRESSDALMKALATRRSSILLYDTPRVAVGAGLATSFTDVGTASSSISSEDLLDPPGELRRRLIVLGGDIGEMMAYNRCGRNLPPMSEGGSEWREN